MDRDNWNINDEMNDSELFGSGTFGDDDELDLMIEKDLAKHARKEAKEKNKNGEKGREEHKLDMNDLIEKGKKGALSASDIDDAIEEFGYDMDKLDKLYETLEDNEIDLPSDDLLVSELENIEQEVERFGKLQTRFIWHMRKLCVKSLVDKLIERLSKQIGRPNAFGILLKFS